MEKKIYISCAYTAAPKEFLDAMNQFKQVLSRDFAVFDFLLGPHAQPHEVFGWSTDCVKDCDLFIPDFTYPSTEIGYELGIAIAYKKNILGIAQKDANVSKLVLGVNYPRFSFRKYDELSELISIIKNEVSFL
jgi:hypothetical protein